MEAQRRTLLARGMRGAVQGSARSSGCGESAGSGNARVWTLAMYDGRDMSVLSMRDGVCCVRVADE